MDNQLYLSNSKYQINHNKIINKQLINKPILMIKLNNKYLIILTKILSIIILIVIIINKIYQV